MDDGQLRRPLVRLLAGRLLVATVLIGGSLGLGGIDLSSTAIFRYFLYIYATSLVSLLWLYRGRATPRFATTQLVIDWSIISGLVWFSGGAESSFSFLFGVLILVAALILGPQASAFMTTTATATYLVLAFGHGWRSADAAKVFASETFAAALLRNVVGLGLLGLLSNILSERLRRTGGELKRAADSAAGYARLTEDIVRSMSAGLMTVDRKGRLQSINIVAENLLGEPGERLVGRPISQIVPIPLGESSTERGECLAHRSDGRTFPVGYTRTPLLSAGGSSHGSLVLFQDLTDIVRLREKAERAERLAALGRLAAGLAHEIRNPLGSISGSVELVREAPSLSAEDKRLLSLVVREVERLNELVTTMLEVGKPHDPDRVELDLAPLANEVVEVARGWCDEMGIDVVRRIESAELFADPGQVRQVLWNLLKNAVQYSQRGQSVFLSCRASNEGAVLEVRDQGAGIESDDLEHLFDMFFTKRQHGVGLGLTLVKRIVDAHGGRVEVESAPERGTTFRVIFPAHARASAPSLPSADSRN